MVYDAFVTLFVGGSFIYMLMRVLDYTLHYNKLGITLDVAEASKEACIPVVVVMVVALLFLAVGSSLFVWRLLSASKMSANSSNLANAAKKAMKLVALLMSCMIVGICFFVRHMITHAMMDGIRSAFVDWTSFDYKQTRNAYIMPYIGEIFGTSLSIAMTSFAKIALVLDFTRASSSS